MSVPSEQPRDGSHYSYAHYADTLVADRFDSRRFGGPIGQLLLETQARILVEALSPLHGRRVADIGTGTGRAALGLSAAGARVIGLDASAAMLQVARERAHTAAVRLPVAQADAHQLPLADRSVDVAVCLRVLMHAVDWRQCLAELCRIARWRVVIDFPALASCAALESATRYVARRLGREVESYRVLSEAGVGRALAAHGFKVIDVKRQFVLPIALHKAIGRRPLTEAVERGFARAGLLWLAGSPVTMVAER